MSREGSPRPDPRRITSTRDLPKGIGALEREGVLARKRIAGQVGRHRQQYCVKPWLRPGRAGPAGRRLRSGDTPQSRPCRAAQQAETDVGGSAALEPMQPDTHADLEMAQMMKASGTVLDRMFLTEMIQLHAAGLPSAHRATPHVEDERPRAMAAHIYRVQAEELVG